MNIYNIYIVLFPHYLGFKCTMLLYHLAMHRIQLPMILVTKAQVSVTDH